MYLYEKGTIEDLKKDRMITTFYAIPQEKEDKAVRYEIWATKFNESGGDFTQLRLIDENNNIIYMTECSGY